MNTRMNQSPRRKVFLIDAEAGPGEVPAQLDVGDHTVIIQTARSRVVADRLRHQARSRGATCESWEATAASTTTVDRMLCWKYGYLVKEHPNDQVVIVSRSKKFRILVEVAESLDIECEPDAPRVDYQVDLSPF